MGVSDGAEFLGAMQRGQDHNLRETAQCCSLVRGPASGRDGSYTGQQLQAFVAGHTATPETSVAVELPRLGATDLDASLPPSLSPLTKLRRQSRWRGRV